MKYRPDIDGLRAIAVGSVLLYHGELLGVTGGFVGVDIFFVISGYLITRILRDDIDSKRFSLARFYDRRIRRILPAYTVVAIAATAAAYVILPPDELASFGRRLASTATFVSNVLFRSESGYFARAAGDNPLLHTWSLSVEEQFYIAWPLFLFVLMRPRFARWRRAVFIACLVGSFALAVYAVSRRPLAAFFYSPLRAWELLMGAMVAMDYVPTLRRGAKDVAGALGIALILMPIFWYTNSTTVFPGAAALAPCLGAALVIAAGRDGPTLVSRALSWKPLVLTGLISYSLYLWHWPILVFVRIYLGRDLTSIDAVECLLASYSLAVLSWIFIEGRFRRRNFERVGFPRSILVASSVLASLFALGVATEMQNGWPARSNERADVAQLEMNISARGVDGCMVDVARGVAPKKRGCLLGPGGESDVRAILLGDSHAGAYAAAIDHIAEERGFTVRQWTKSSCSPSVAGAGAPSKRGAAIMRDNGEESCRRYMQAALYEITTDSSLKTVIIAGFWSSLSDDEEANATRRPASLADQTKLRSGLTALVGALHQAGKTVVLLGQVPVFPNGGGDCIVRQRFLNRNEDVVCAVPYSYETALLSPSDTVLREIAETYENVYVYRASSEFCVAGECRPTFDGHLAFRDEHHLTFGGSVHLAQDMMGLFERAGL